MCSLLSSKHGTAFGHTKKKHQKEGDQDGGISERQEQEWQESGRRCACNAKCGSGGFSEAQRRCD